ncbi:hypothetical protein [Oceanirhabdus seepicola]|uniref:Uncharacterized protein n=1 Tax=Oceanirhabdus seepicola TaxID=2828781 RepID=A0A9J6NX19_9CLOT|nr:hypothetical protein [Oceanirhabdus seepicola]MCM1988441.1 hypothetical protein [Oceanirhabdus seepicola]
MNEKQKETAKKILNLFTELANVLRKEDTNEIDYVMRKIIYIIKSLDKSINLKEYNFNEVISEIGKIYKGLFPTHGGLTDFYIWREDFEERKKANEILDKIKEEIWKQLNLIR